MSVWEVLKRIFLNNVFLLLPCQVLMVFLYVCAIAHIAHWEKELSSHQKHSERQQSMSHSMSTCGFGVGPQGNEYN